MTFSLGASTGHPPRTVADSRLDAAAADSASHAAWNMGLRPGWSSSPSEVVRRVGSACRSMEASSVNARSRANTGSPMCHEWLNVPLKVDCEGFLDAKYVEQSTLTAFELAFAGSPTRPARGEVPSRFALEIPRTLSWRFE